MTQPIPYSPASPSPWLDIVCWFLSAICLANYARKIVLRTGGCSLLEWLQEVNVLQVVTKEPQTVWGCRSLLCTWRGCGLAPSLHWHLILMNLTGSDGPVSESAWLQYNINVIIKVDPGVSRLPRHLLYLHIAVGQKTFWCTRNIRTKKDQ